VRRLAQRQVARVRPRYSLLAEGLPTNLWNSERDPNTMNTISGVLAWILDPVKMLQSGQKIQICPHAIDLGGQAEISPHGTSCATSADDNCGNKGYGPSDPPLNFFCKDTSGAALSPGKFMCELPRVSTTAEWRELIKQMRSYYKANAETLCTGCGDAKCKGRGPGVDQNPDTEFHIMMPESPTAADKLSSHP
jgi:hypothetical protein